MGKAKTKEKTKRPVGHPVTRWTPVARAELLQRLIDYVEVNDIPILAEFSFQVKVDRSDLYKYEELVPAIKLLMAKKEVGLERLMHKDPKVTTGCIFSLKQLGWRDRQEISGPDGKPLEISLIKRVVVKPEGPSGT